VQGRECAAQAERAVALFRDHDRNLMDEQYAVRQDESQLIQTAAQAAAQLQEVFEADVEESNTPARRLYARAGFREVGRRPGYYPGGKGALVLRRDLV